MKLILGHITAFLILMFGSGGAGANTLVLDQKRDAHELAPVVEILEDPDLTFTLDQVLTDRSADFSPNPYHTVSIGRTASAIWLRFKLADLPPDPFSVRHQWFLEVGKQGLGSIDLFIPMASGSGPSQYRKVEFGSWRPFPREHVPSRTSVVALPSTWNTRAWFFMRVKSDTSLNFPIHIKSPRGMITHMTRDHYAFGILFGILLGMILYNFSIFIFLRDRAYLSYVFYIISMFWYLTLIYGQFEMIVKPSQVVMDRLFFVAAGSAWLFGGTFSRLFLNTKTHAPVMDRMILGVMGAGLVVSAAAFSGHTYLAHGLNIIMGMVGPVVAITAAVRVRQKNFPPATYFLVAWLILMSGAILYSMGGILIPRTPVTVYTFAAGAGIEAVLLSLALADRIRMLETEKEVLRQREIQLQRVAATDHLTGLFNRRPLLETLAKEIDLANSMATPLSLLILDVDNFKKYNDAYGHPEGDKVLKTMAGVLCDHLREKDFPCRYGGEEFAVILPQAERSQAVAIAERIRLAFSEKIFHPLSGEKVRVTVSIGAAELKPGITGEGLIRTADQALYAAKRKGRNQVAKA